MLTISGSSGSGSSGVSSIDSVEDCSGGSLISACSDTEDDSSVFEETGGSIFGVSQVEDGSEDSELEEDFEDFSEFDKDSEIFVVEIVEIVTSAADVLDETEPAGSLTVVDDIGGSLSSDDCGLLDRSLVEISGCVELFSEFSDKTGGSFFISTEAEELDCGDDEL